MRTNFNYLIGKTATNAKVWGGHAVEGKTATGKIVGISEESGDRDSDHVLMWIVEVESNILFSCRFWDGTTITD